MLTALVTTPFVGALLVMIMPSNEATRNLRVKQVALLTSVVAFGLSVILWVLFDGSCLGYQLQSTIFAVDGLALPFVMLTAFLTPLALLASWENVVRYTKAYFSLQLIVEGILLAVFVVTDGLSFYVAFEAVLIPLFITVGVWGGSPTRIRSAILLFMFTLAGSLCMLLSLATVYAYAGTTDFMAISALDQSLHTYIWLGVFIAFAVKTPLVPFHMWLPRAHADGPLAASMVLAGTVLKMATYGYLRLCVQLMPEATEYYAPLAQTMGLISLVYASLATIRQNDLKALIAYSSVGHMAVVVLGLFSGTQLGIEGAVLLSLAHGFVSPALFVIVGGVLYDRFHTRVLAYYRGVGLYMPLFATAFFIATACNMGVPLSANWLGEFATLAGIFDRAPLVSAIAASGIVLSALYSIWLWVRVVAGGYSSHLTWTIDLTRRESAILVALLAPAIMLGVYAEPVLAPLHLVVTGLLT